MLRVAVPNKGALAEPSAQILREAGYRQRGAGRELVLVDPDSEIEFYYLRPRDVAIFVADGTLDIGITGRDILLDTGAAADEVFGLGFARSTLRLAAEKGTISSIGEAAGRRIATSYATVLTRALADRGVEASVIHLEGAVESSIRLGVADLIADVVETGLTLREHGLEPFGEPLLESEAILIRARTLSPNAEPARIDQLIHRLRGVLLARTYVMMDYDIRADQVDRATEVAPGREGPTVSPLHREGWVAVRVMVPRSDAQRLMDELWEIGARAILVTEILACRL